jgi:hypothetical protein
MGYVSLLFKITRESAESYDFELFTRELLVICGINNENIESSVLFTK